jgi:ferredoxin
MAIFAAPLLLVFDPFNIFHMSLEGIRIGIGFSAFLKASFLFVIILINILFPNIWCRSICPLGGLQLLAFDARKIFRGSTQKQKSSIRRRRLFISTLAGLGAGFIITRVSNFVYSNTIRPPGSMSEPDMNLICARCGNCSGVCPTNIIKPSDNISNIARLLTPVIDFSESYCLPECTLCGDVCPSGAIKKFKQDEKKGLHMASVSIDTDKCWLQNQRDCDLCRFHCAYNAIEIKKTGNDPLALPVLTKDKCVGCAACKIICPADAIKIKLI